MSCHIVGGGMDRKADGMCSKGTTLLIRISRPTSTIKVTQKHVTTDQVLNVL